MYSLYIGYTLPIWDYNSTVYIGNFFAGGDWHIDLISELVWFVLTRIALMKLVYAFT